MNSFARSTVFGLTTFAFGVVGMLLQWSIPADTLTASKGSVAAMVGLVGLLLALVLGLLIWTAFAVFANQQSEAYSLGPIVAEIDLALETYGPEAAAGRAGLRAVLQRSRARFFGGAELGPQPYTFEEMRGTFAGLSGYFDGLQPATDVQRRSLTLASDLARKYQDTQMLMARQLANPFPPHVLNIVVWWACALFFGNGVVSTPNAITVIALFAGATAIATAIFLILELSHPYAGIIRLSPAGLDHLLRALEESPPATA